MNFQVPQEKAEKPSLFTSTTSTAEQLAQALQTSLEHGLTEQQVEQKQKEYGLNEIPEVVHTLFYFIWQQCKSPFFVVLIVAALLSFFLHDIATMVTIIIMLIINAVVGAYQEYKADQSVHYLKQLLVSNARVVRNGKEIDSEVRYLVPGDIVVIDPGDIVPADLRLFEVEDLKINEAPLTGESMPVQKVADPLEHAASEVIQATNIAFAGTTVATGRGKGVVVQTGINTVQGNIGKIADEIVAQSIFAQDITRFTRLLLYFVFVLFVAITVVHLVWGKTDATFFDIILFVLALAIAIMPEALPVVILLTLSRAARKLAEKKVIVKRLSAVNDLGAVSVLCTDKTGTLTENSMTASSWMVHNVPESEFLLMAALASERPQIKGTGSHSLDSALWSQLHDELLLQAESYNVVKHFPFDPAKRSNAVVVHKNGQEFYIMRGALEIIAQESALDQQDPVFAWANKEGLEGRRVLAVARGKPLTFLGAISFTDPIKKSVAPALEKARGLNVKIKIITGDAPEVTTAVALKTGIIQQGDQVCLGKEFEALSPEEKEQAVRTCNVFARVTPEQKYHIIQTLQKEHAVGYLGDGINDVLALKAAHVAMSVQGAADVAREASDIILLKKSLMAIIDGIELGREAVANTKKYVLVTLSSNLGNAFSIALASFLVTFLPLRPIQILVLNVLSDFPMFAIALDTVDPEELDQPSRFDMQKLLIFVVVLGGISSVFDFTLFYLLADQPPAVIQTYWFVNSMLTELFLIISLRSRRFFMFAKFPAPILLCTIFGVAAATIALPQTSFGQEYLQFVPLAWWGIKMVILILVSYVTLTKCVKLLLYRYISKLRDFVVSFIP